MNLPNIVESPTQLPFQTQLYGYSCMTLEQAVESYQRRFGCEPVDIWIYGKTIYMALPEKAKVEE